MNPAHRSLCRAGFWSAVATSGLAAISFAIAIFATPLNRYPYPYTPPYIPIDFAWLIPASLLLPAFVVLTVVTCSAALGDKQVFGRLALSFAIVSAVLLMADYFVQWAVILPSTLAGETSGLSLFTQYNPHGFFVALEALGYLMMSTAFLFLAPLLGGGRLQRSIRWLFVGSFALAASAFVGLSLAGYDIVLFEVVVITIDWLVLVVAGALLAILYRNADRQTTGPA